MRVRPLEKLDKASSSHATVEGSSNGSMVREAQPLFHFETLIFSNMPGRAVKNGLYSQGKK